MEEHVRSVGEILRRAREEKKLSLEDVNKDTKISLKVLSALEQDDIDSFESEMYLKGFLKNYANFLKLDLDLVIGALERQRGRVHTGKATLWEIEEAMTEEKLTPPRILSRFILPLLLIIIVVLCVLLVKERRKAKNLDRGNKYSYLQVDKASEALVALAQRRPQTV